jgi:hypothetical protein
MAAWSIMVGSAVVVLSGFETLSQLHSMEVREGIEDALSKAPAAGLGLDVGAVQQAIRIGTMVAAGCATAAVILGYQVLQRNRSARVALSVLAVPLFVAGISTGGFFSSLVAVCVAMLWLHPARAWFNGTWRPDADKMAPATLTPPLPPLAPPASPAEEPPPAPVTARPMTGFGIPVAPERAVVPEPAGAPVPGPPAVRPAGRAPRPAALIWAGVLTWVFSALALLSVLVAVGVLATDSGPVLAELHRQQPDLAAQGISDELIVNATYVMAGVVSVWSVLAMVLAGFAVAGARWAWVGLLVSAASATALFAVCVLVGQLLMLLPLLGSLTACVCLLRPRVRDWLARPA